ncbi:MAG TPA: hypothetical protein DEH78_13735 [Solibacterales bacterium]|nr:hypothetical protein [Bryobacterales bacterium]
MENALTALAALDALGINKDDIETGMAAARWPGRLEFVRENPTLVFDGAHNPAGARTLAAYIRRFHAHRRIWMIFGAMRDKPVDEIAATLFPLAHRVIATRPDQTRALEPEAIAAQAHQPVQAVASVREAFAMVERLASPEDVVFVTGSLYLVGEARALLLEQGA